MEKHRDRLFVTFKGDFVYRRYSYNKILDLALRFITFLKEKDIRRGDCIAVCTYNSPQYFYVFLGCMFHGVTLVPIDYASSPELIKKFYMKTRCKMIVTSVHKILGLKRVNTEELDDILSSRRPGKVNMDVGDDDLLEILFTSGTTGDPKGVMLTHDNIYSNLTSVLKIIKITRRYRLVSILPLSHVFEQVAGFLGLIEGGASTIHLKSRMSSEIVKVMKKEKITAIVTVPAFLILFQRRIEERAGYIRKMVDFGYHLPIFLRRALFRRVHKGLGNNLKHFICGAASIPIETERFWEAMGVKVLKGYGLTEASPILTVTRENERVLGSVGKRIPGVRIKLGKDNEILASGKNITKGYYKNPDATKKIFEGMWLKTGDIGEFDDDKNLYIRGRIKNMILKPTGLNVYPEDIEKVLDKERSIKESCVLGIEKGNDVIITAVLLLKEKLGEKDIRKLIERTNSELEEHQKIQDTLIWKKKEFPKTLTLKIKRHDVKKEVEDKTHSKHDSKDDLISLLSEMCHMDVSMIDDKSRLYADLGFDSLKIIELSTLIEERMRCEIDESRIDEKTTVNNIRQLIKEGKKHYELHTRMFSPLNIPIKAAALNLLYLVYSRNMKRILISGYPLKKLAGQYIFVLNHTSHLDAPLLGKMLPKNIRYKTASGAASDLFFQEKRLKHRLLQRFFFAMGMFPVAREKEDKRSIKETFDYIGEAIDRDWSIALAPEGTRSPDGKIQPFKNGIGVIIKETNLPVVPVKIRGLYEIMPREARFPKGKSDVEMIFGNPILFSKRSSPIEITKELENIMREM
jgi:long-chain acyl-CoA synthetase